MKRQVLRSKQGCYVCKKRKVKCDEYRPQCSNCKKYQFQCVYPSPFQQSKPGSKSSRRASSRESSKAPELPTEMLTNPTSLPLVYTATDMELLHHYATETHATLSNVSDKCTAYQKVVPPMALLHPYLFHCMLSISAQHLSRLDLPQDKRNRYALLSDAHYGASLRALPSNLQDALNDNCNAMFAFSSIVCIIAVANAFSPGFNEHKERSMISSLEHLSIPSSGYHGGSPNSTSTDSNTSSAYSHNPFNPLPTWLVLIRGIAAIVRPVRNRMLTGPFRSFVLYIFHEDPPPLPTGLYNRLQSLRPLWSIEVDPTLTPQERKECDYTLEMLCKVYSMTLEDDPDACLMKIVMTWLVMAGEGYMALLQRGQPGAMELMGWVLRIWGRMQSYWWVDQGPQDYLNSMLRGGWIKDTKFTEREEEWLKGGKPTKGLFA